MIATKLKSITIINFLLFSSFNIYCQVIFSDRNFISNSKDYQSEINIGDIDGNNRTDLLISKNFSLIRYEIVNEIDGLILLDTLVSSDGPIINSILIDMDNDSDLDVIYSESINNQISWIENINGDGLFSQPIPIITKYSEDLGAGDFDGDGDIDLLVVPNSEFFNISWFENPNDSTLFIEHTGFPITTNVSRALVTDVNEDGYSDVITLRTGVMRLFTNDGNGTFGGSQQLYSNNGGNSIFLSSDLVDFDNDGDKDIIASLTGIWDNGLYLFENQNGFFAPEQLLLDSIHLNFELTDFDNDGDYDVLEDGALYDTLTEQFCRTIQIHENINGINQFATPQIIDIECRNNFYPVKKDFIALNSDIDYDGDLDILVVENNSEKIFWHENYSMNPQVSGSIFYDQNINGNKDSLEISLFDGNVNILPQEITHLPNTSGNYNILANPGWNQISSEINANWELVTDSSVFTVFFGRYNH